MLHLPEIVGSSLLVVLVAVPTVASVVVFRDPLVELALRLRRLAHRAVLALAFDPRHPGLIDDRQR